MKREKIGATALYLFRDPPEPYKAVHADLFKCSNCGMEVVAQFADSAFWNHHYDVPAPDTDDKYVFLVYEKAQWEDEEDSHITQIQIGTKNSSQSIS
jgi:hypothetical protein